MGYFCFTIRVIAPMTPPLAKRSTPPSANAALAELLSCLLTGRKRPFFACLFISAIADGPPIARVHSGRIIASPPDSASRPPVGE